MKKSKMTIFIDLRAIKGHPTIFMKIINYSLFVASSSVKNYLYSKGVDPDTVYLNDFKFMSKVFKILVAIFGYKASITIEQFFKISFAEQKMLLCCDIINLVKKAARDIKIQRSLSRKRSQTSRDQQSSTFTIVDHKKSAQKDFTYERDNVKKVAKVKILDNKLQDSRRSIADSKRVSIAESQAKSPSRLSGGSLSRTTRNLRYAHVQSRYLEPQKSRDSLCRTIDSDKNNQDISSIYKPLRIRQSVHNSEEKATKKTVEAVQPAYQTPNFINGGAESVIVQLKEAIVMLNSKFDTFQNTIDKKISTMHNDYKSLETKLETLHSTKKHDSHAKERDLKERGQIASPYHFSVNAAEGEVVNPLKEFTFSEKGAAQRAMYSTDGFAYQKHQSIRDELRDESRTLIDSIRKGLDQSKKVLDLFKSEPEIAQ